MLRVNHRNEPTNGRVITRPQETTPVLTPEPEAVHEGQNLFVVRRISSRICRVLETGEKLW